MEFLEKQIKDQVWHRIEDQADDLIYDQVWFRVGKQVIVLEDWPKHPICAVVKENLWKDK